MVNSRSYIVPGACTTYRQLVSRFYGADEPKSRPVALMARCDGDSRYPLVESVLGGMAIQPYVHDCSVSVLHHNRWSRYTIFYRIHHRLPINRAAALVSGSIAVHGDVLVMWTDDDGRVVGMRHGDAVIADQIVKRLAEHLDSLHYRKKRVPPTTLMVITTVSRSLRQWRLFKAARERRREAARERLLNAGRH
ncbi:hypothetical protein BD414DRAFT_514825 [Trametes punicea]|nr:hypothetical protein BD414DRAFT_514825 [Trametes punicea]